MCSQTCNPNNCSLNQVEGVIRGEGVVCMVSSRAEKREIL